MSLSEPSPAATDFMAWITDVESWRRFDEVAQREDEGMTLFGAWVSEVSHCEGQIHVVPLLGESQLIQARVEQCMRNGYDDAVWDVMPPISCATPFLLSLRAGMRIIYHGEIQFRPTGVVPVLDVWRMGDFPVRTRTWRGVILWKRKGLLRRRIHWSLVAFSDKQDAHVEDGLVHSAHASEGTYLGESDKGDALGDIELPKSKSSAET